MGKCGGRELNYVSDVDVIFVAPATTTSADAQVIAARMMQICGPGRLAGRREPAPRGQPGTVGAHARLHLAYYRKWARTWEFQALLKARPAAGDLALGQEWLAALQPLIWHAAERPEAVDDVRAMRRRIIDNVPAEGARPGDQARPGWPARHRVRRAAAAARARPRRRVVAVAVHTGRSARVDRRRLRGPPRWRGARAGVPLSSYGGAPAAAAAAAAHAHRAGRPHAEGARRCAGSRRRSASAATRARRRPSRSAPPGSPTPRRCAGCTEAGLPAAAGGGGAGAERVAAVDAGGGPRRLEILGFRDPAGALRHLEALTGGVSRYAAIQHTLLPVLLGEFADAPEPDRGLLAYRQVSDTLGPPPGSCACSATKAQWRCGWPGCSACPATSPTCLPATRRRCG